LNARRYVSAPARARVEAAIRDLGFVPNRAARNLSTARTATVALIVHHTQYPSRGEGTFAARALDGVSRALHGHGYDLLYTIVDDEAMERLPTVPAAGAARSDGLLLLGPAIPARAILALRAAGRPIVLIDNLLSGAHVDAVMVDNRPAAETLTRHLIDMHGPRRIVCLAGPPTWPSSVERTAGYRAALEAAGMEPMILHAAETTVRDGDRMAAALLDDPPDAVVAINDAMAIGALHRLRGLGRRRPAVVGFDDIAWAEMTNPPLTTVAIDAEELGRLAAERLVERLGAGDREAHDAPTVTRVTGSLRIRQSCGCEI
jgi:DNA-binding LacI/PurR family transcriptional regulator